MAKAKPKVTLVGYLMSDMASFKLRLPTLAIVLAGVGAPLVLLRLVGHFVGGREGALAGLACAGLELAVLMVLLWRGYRRAQRG